MNNPLVQLDPGLYIWTIATFLVLLALLAKFAWRPLLQALDERQAEIRKSLDEAQQARQELERVQHESAHRLARPLRRGPASPGAARHRAGRGGGHPAQRREADRAPDAAGGPADQNRGGGPVRDDRGEADRPAPLEGRQRAADRRNDSAIRHSTAISKEKAQGKRQKGNSDSHDPARAAANA
jgi:hypothetical protein